MRTSEDRKSGVEWRGHGSSRARAGGAVETYLYYVGTGAQQQQEQDSRQVVDDGELGVRNVAEGLSWILGNMRA
jgi:hypothetical protein